MKSKHSLLILTGALFLGLSFQALPQNTTSQDKARQLEEKKQQIERLAKENEELKQKISEHESAITDFKSQIESLDQKIQKRKEEEGTAAGKDST